MSRQACACIPLLLGVGAFSCAAELKPWTVADSVAVRYFVQAPQSSSPGLLREPLDGESPFVFSPDREHFFFVSFSGDVKTDLVKYRLEVFASKDVRYALSRFSEEAKAPAPVRVVEMSTARSDDDSTGIYVPHWRGNDDLVFVGTPGGHELRLYRLAIGNGAVQSLTHPGDDVVLNGGADQLLDVRGDAVIFASRGWRPWTPLGEYPYATVKSNELWQIMEPRKMTAGSFISLHGQAKQQIRMRQDFQALSPRISPDKRWAIAAFPPEKVSIPAEWAAYEFKPEYGYQYMLVDMTNGASRPLFDAPLGTVTSSGRGLDRPNDAFWSADSQTALLFNTALPLSEAHPERRNTSYLAEYSLKDGSWRPVAPMTGSAGDRVVRAEWLVEGTQVRVVSENTSTHEATFSVFVYRSGRWERASESSASLAANPDRREQDGFELSLRQSVNDPPMVVASRDSRSIELTVPDPAMNNLWRAEASLVTVPDAGGRDVHGRLYLPRSYVEGQRLPLVIQASDEEWVRPAQSFLPDGSAATGYAAQALVAAGFAVIHLESSFTDASRFISPAEGPAQVKTVDAAVEWLAKKGIIDPTQVGLLGFSRSGFLTYYVATHSGKTRLAGAAVFDSVTAGYGEYVNEAGMGDMGAEIYEKQYGEGTFWQNKNAWLDAPAFNVDRVEAPVLFSTAGETTRWGMLETIGAFRYCRKPFEYLHFPNGAHVLQRPRERAAAMQATVDWMSFWILGVERGDADASERYARWRQMRTDLHPNRVAVDTGASQE